MNDPYILTYSGQKVSGSEGVPTLMDIAAALSRIPRFAGHGRVNWSVLDHSLFCYDIARHTEQLRFGAPSLGLAMLLHDAHEALTGDIPSPMKSPEMKSLQWLLDIRIMDAYFPGGFDAYDVMHNLVKAVDHDALLVEALTVGPITLQTDKDVLEHFGAVPRTQSLAIFNRHWDMSVPHESTKPHVWLSAVTKEQERIYGASV